jgi:hypothetical protein
MGVFTALLSERVTERAGRWLPLLLLAGLGSVEYWRRSGDLRPYLCVQYFPLAALPCLLVWRPARYPANAGWWWLLGLYAAAKGFEMLDGAVFERSGGLISGHPLKHVAASLALVAAFRMIARRGTFPAAAESRITEDRSRR